MARAEAASASARPDSIKGLAQSIAGPAYRRLLSAEPALRRAVPALIVAFLVSVGIGAVIQAFAHRTQAIIDVAEDIELVAEILADRLEQAAGDGRADVSLSVQRAMERGLPRLAAAPGRWLLVTNGAGVIVAARLRQHERGDAGHPMRRVEPRPFPAIDHRHGDAVVGRANGDETDPLARQPHFDRAGRAGGCDLEELDRLLTRFAADVEALTQTMEKA